MRRARDREVQRCRDDMLSKDETLNAVAKKRLDDLDRAFEYLTEPKKFRDFLELVNDKLQSGNIEAGTLIASIAQKEGIEAGAQEDDGGTTGPLGAGGASGPLTQSSGTSLAEEREVLKELRRKRMEKAPKVGQKQRQEMEKLIKDTLTAIEQGANSAARSKASELVARGVTDSDEFYEKVYLAALEVSKAARTQAIEKIEQKSLPVDEKLKDEWEQAALDKSEEAAEREYNNLEGIMAAQKPTMPSGPKFMLRLALVLCTIAGALCIFCNINSFVSVKDFNVKDASDTTSGDVTKIFQTLPLQVSPNKQYAFAAGLVPSAGQAGTAGMSESLAIDGAAAYNAGCKAITSGAYQDAIASFTSAIDKNRNIYQFYYNRALAFLALGNYRGAIADFDAAIGLRNDLMLARYNKGAIYLAGGQDYIVRAENAKGTDKAKFLQQAAINLRAAVAEFSVVAAKVPDIPQALYNRGLARYRLGDLNGAIVDFQSASDRDEKLTAAKYNLDLVHSSINNDGKAIVTGTAPGAPMGPQGPPGPGFF